MMYNASKLVNLLKKHLSSLSNLREPEDLNSQFFDWDIEGYLFFGRNVPDFLLGDNKAGDPIIQDGKHLHISDLKKNIGALSQ